MNLHNRKTPMEETPTEDALHLRLKAQPIVRYHVLDIPEHQTVGEHTYGATQILRYLVEGKSSEYRLQAIEAILDHDVPEALIGDTPHTTKIDYEGFVDVLAELEDEIIAEFQLNRPLSLAMELDCKCADMLEMAWYSYRLILKGNAVGFTVLENVINWFDTLRNKPEKAEVMLTVIQQLVEELHHET